MSNLRQQPGLRRDLESLDADILVRTYAVRHPPDLHLPEQTMNRWHQLVHPSRGVLRVVTRDQEWVVPPQRAVWVPAGSSHTVYVCGNASLRTLYFAVDQSACFQPAKPSAESPTPQRPGRRTRAIAVSPLLGELILEACRRGVLRDDRSADRHLAGLTLELIEALPDGPLHLSIPKDPRAVRAAAILRSPEEMCSSLDEVAALSGASKRTLERVFAQETGVTLGRWRRRARVAFALERLAHGRPISEVALDAGYASASAFTVAFRAETGGTPGNYFA